MGDSRKRILWFTIINAFLSITTVIVTYITLSFGTVAGQVDTSVAEGWFYILTFTVQSNILLGAVALCGVVFGIRKLKWDKPIPKKYAVWYLVAASAVMLTSLTVIFFLAPKRAMQGKGYFEMMMGPMFFFHFFNPFLSAAAFIFLMPKERLSFKNCLFAPLAPAAYAVPYILNVVVLHSWYDFYGFTFGGKNWVVLPVFLVISLITLGISAILVFCHNRYFSKK